MRNNNKPSPAPNELAALGENIYFNKQNELEKSSLGQFAVIDIDSKEIFIDSDKLTAIQKAQSKYPNKLFYIVQIGNLKQSSNSELNEVKKYGWSF